MLAAMDERNKAAIAAIQPLMDAYTEDQGGADIVYVTALFCLKHYEWDEAILQFRHIGWMISHGLQKSTMDAYYAVRDILAPDGFPAIEEASPEARAEAVQEVDRLWAEWDQASQKLQRLQMLWRIRLAEESIASGVKREREDGR